MRNCFRRVYKLLGCIQLNTHRKVTKGAVAYINESCIKDIVMQLFLNVDTACEQISNHEKTLSDDV